MPLRSDESQDDIRTKIIGLGESSIRKSYYPELQRRMGELERFRTLLDHSNDIILMFKVADGILTDVNRAASIQLGYSEQELLEKNIFHLLEKNAADFLKLLAQNDIGVENRVVSSFFHKDGMSLPVEISFQTVDFENTRFGVVIGRDIAERLLAEKSIRRNLQHMSILQAVATAGNIAANEDLLIELVTIIIGQSLYLDYFGLFMLDSQRQELYPHPSYRGMDSEGRKKRISVQQGITGKTLRTGHAYRIDNVKNVPEYIAWSDKQTFLSELCVPLVIGEDIVGVINAESTREAAFSEDDEHLLTIVSEQLATSIEKMRHYEASQRRARELDVLYQTAVATSGELSSASLINQINKQVEQFFDPDFLQVYIYDAESDCIELVSSYEHGLEMYLPQAVKIPAREMKGLVAWVLDHQSALNITDLKGKNLVVRPGEMDPQDGSWLGAPLTARGEKLGAVIMQSRQKAAFDQANVDLVTAMASQVGVALSNARLYEMERKRSNELVAISRVTAALREAQTREEIVTLLLDEISVLMETEAVALIVPTPGLDAQLCEAAKGVWSKYKGKTIPRNVWFDHILTSAQPVVVPSIRDDPKYQGLGPLSEIYSVVGAPLYAQSRLIGGLWIGRNKETTPQDLRLVTAIAGIAANAIQRTSLHEQTQIQLSHLAALHDIDLAITGTVDMRVTLNIFLSQLVAQLGVDATAVMILDPALRTLNFAAGRGFWSEAVERCSVRLGEDITGNVALEQKMVQVDDLNAPGVKFSRMKWLENEKFVSYIGMPLVSRGEVKGVLDIFHRSPLKPDANWINYLDALATQAAIAIDHASMFHDLQHSNEELNLAYDSTLEGWSSALELRDQETEGHTRRVADMTIRMARVVGLNEHEIIHARRGALLHDIGKMGIPDSILLKPGPLTPDEWEVMRKHPEYAYKLLVSIPFLRPALEIPYCHHEKWNGSGYPQGLRGEQIPLAARIFALIDVWDALLSNRPYRPAWPKEKVIQLIRAESGKHFDPALTEVFLSLFS